MNIALREVQIDDSENIVKWRNSPNVVRHCIDKTVISEESNRKFYEEMVVPGLFKQYIVEKFDGEFGGVFAYKIGTMYFKDIDKDNRKCEIGLFPSDDEEWNSEGQELALLQMLEIAFDKMSIHKVYAYVYSDCHEEVELFTRCGFSVEGELKAEIYDDGKYRDVIRFSVIR